MKKMTIYVTQYAYYHLKYEAQTNGRSLAKQASVILNEILSNENKVKCFRDNDFGFVQRCARQRNDKQVSSVSLLPETIQGIKALNDAYGHVSMSCIISALLWAHFNNFDSSVKEERPIIVIPDEKEDIIKIHFSISENDYKNLIEMSRELDMSINGLMNNIVTAYIGNSALSNDDRAFLKGISLLGEVYDRISTNDNKKTKKKRMVIYLPESLYLAFRESCKSDDIQENKALSLIFSAE